MHDMTEIRTIFLDTASVARSVIASPAIAAHWDEPSALPYMSVRALAGHLARATFTVETYLSAPPPDGVKPASALDYYLRPVTSAAWTELSSTFNQQIRERGEAQAASGQIRLVADLDASIRRLRGSLETEADDRVLAATGGLPIRLDEYLVTRIAELAIHTDDLAVSVDLEPPPLPSSAVDITINLLVDLARRRHGNLAILRALARRERDTTNALRVF